MHPDATRVPKPTVPVLTITRQDPPIHRFDAVPVRTIFRDAGDHQNIYMKTQAVSITDGQATRCVNLTTGGLIDFYGSDHIIVLDADLVVNPTPEAIL